MLYLRLVILWLATLGGASAIAQPAPALAREVLALYDGHDEDSVRYSRIKQFAEMPSITSGWCCATPTFATAFRASRAATACAGY